MSQYLFPDEAQLDAVNDIQVPYETNGKIMLLAELIALSPQPTYADLLAIEADFTGYARKTIASLPTPYYDDQRGGVSFGIPTQQFTVASPGSGDDLVTNTIYGAAYLDASNNILSITTWNPGYALLHVGDALPLDQLYNFFSSGPNAVYTSVNGTPV